MTQYQISDADQEIYDLFDHRCVMCGAWAVTIHEIIPRSHGKSSMNPKNRVPICNKHHQWAHDIGTRNSIPVLQRCREGALKRYAKELSSNSI